MFIQKELGDEGEPAPQVVIRRGVERQVLDLAKIGAENPLRLCVAEIRIVCRELVATAANARAFAPHFLQGPFSTDNGDERCMVGLCGHCNHVLFWSQPNPTRFCPGCGHTVKWPLLLPEPVTDKTVGGEA